MSSPAALCAGLPTPHTSPTEGLLILSPCREYEYRCAEHEHEHELPTRENETPAESSWENEAPAESSPEKRAS
ncbi:MAG: hypothetical protein KDA71_13715, partial [Planctomycetales bacterium]|nr:hypothetical protein [Planctomycetales bacterium]